MAERPRLLLRRRGAAAKERKRGYATLCRRALALAAKRDGPRERGVASRVPQRLHYSRWVERGGASHLWLPLWCGAVWREQSAGSRAKRGFNRIRDPEAVFGADDLPVRPCAAQHAEDEMIAASARRHPASISF